MEIKDLRPKNKVYAFIDLKEGQCFTFNNQFYMKIEEKDILFCKKYQRINAVNIETGASTYIENFVVVNFLSNAKFVIE